VADYPVAFGSPLKDEELTEVASEADIEERRLPVRNLRRLVHYPISEDQTALSAVRDILYKPDGTPRDAWPDLKTLIHSRGGLAALLLDETVKSRWGGWFPIQLTQSGGSIPPPLIPVSSHKLGEWRAKSGIKGDAAKRMKARLEALAKTVPWKVGSTSDQPVKSTPILNYYIARYLAAFLIHNNMAYQAMPKPEKDDRAINAEVKAERISVKASGQSRKDMDIIVNDLYTRSHIDADSPVDHLFDFSPIGTIIRYPEDWDSGDGQPQAGDDFIPGLLQKLYSRLGTDAKEEFRSSVRDMIRKIPHDSIQIADNPNVKAVIIHPHIIEQVIVWIEEMEVGDRTKRNLHATDHISQPPERLTQGSTLSISGLLILLNLKDGARSIIKRIFGSALKPTSRKWDDKKVKDLRDELNAQGIRWKTRDAKSTLIDAIPHDLGEYLLAQSDREKELNNEKEDILVDAESLSDEQQERLESIDEELEILETAYGHLRAFAQYNFTAVINSISQNEVALYLEDTPGEIPMADQLTVYVKPQLFRGNRILPSERANLPGSTKAHSTGLYTSRWLFRNLPDLLSYVLSETDWAEERDEAEAMGDEPGIGYFDLPWTDTREASDNTAIELLRPVLLESVEDTREVQSGEARAFAALGRIVGWCLRNSATKVAETMPKHSYFDNVVNALTGKENQLGLASYHAVLHYQYLFEMLRETLSGSGGRIQEGRSLTLEIYSQDPAKLMLYWMLTEKKYIDIAGIGPLGVPEFFSIPLDQSGIQRTEVNMMNGLATLIVGYYRLAFSPLRMRRQGKDWKGQGLVNLPVLWDELNQDAKKDPPQPHAFAGVLRFLSGPKQPLKIPAWMTTLPKDLTGKKRRDPEEVRNYLKWAYGDNPTSTEVFAEVLAAYHAAKAISYYEPGDYADMVERFVDAVAEDGGHAFLMALLLLPDEDWQEILGTPAPLEPIPYTLAEPIL
jgi:hypothetical protein